LAKTLKPQGFSTLNHTNS